nr:UDP-galactose transporter [Polyrhizophydium stewartii]
MTTAAATAAATTAPVKPGTFELLFCVAGIYACFLTWGVTQERVSTTPYGEDKERFRFFVFLNQCQALIAALVGVLFVVVRRLPLGTLSPALLLNYVRLSIITSMASPFGYAALKHIDYPTLVLGKSCKLIPVMLMNFIMYRRTFPLQKYLVVLLVTVGVSTFMLQQPVSPGKAAKGLASSSLLGIGLLSCNLLLDGAVNSIQDRIFSRFKVSGASMMVWMNVISFVLMTVYLLMAPYTHDAWAFASHAFAPVTRLLPPYLAPATLAASLPPQVLDAASMLDPYTTELWDAIAFCRRQPAVVFDVVLFGFAGAVGQCFIFHTLERFGAIVLVTVTVTRKMFSILLSVFAFNHRVTLGQWGSVALVFAGIIWESFGKSHGKGKKHVAEDVSPPGSVSAADTKAARK